ncbi:hypothetical protein FRB99_005353 [Tulasnella sp. 403]|nr:hypothetical protein FRB99_005353 [Tulasnella sp. 403]
MSEPITTSDDLGWEYNHVLGSRVYNSPSTNPEIQNGYDAEQHRQPAFELRVMITAIALRDCLLQDLATLPGSSHLQLHVLLTAPRKSPGLFPHSSLPAKQRAKIFQQDYLILLAQSASDAQSEYALTSAIEAALYTLPHSNASILYISKVDSTGQASLGTVSPTSILVKAFLHFFLDPTTRPTPLLRTQLFARAQGQYLFPDSSLHSGKRVLTDVQLCKWWKDVFTDAVNRVRSSITPESNLTIDCKCFYLFPGLSPIEAENMLRRVVTNKPIPIDANLGDACSAIPWVYGHPYTLDHSTPFSIPTTSADSAAPLGVFDRIPTFSDDPKARFLAELAATSKHDASALSAPKSPARKRQKSVHSEGPEEGEGSDTTKTSKAVTSSKRSASDITPDEFWQRMDFRQECSAGAVTGFFVVDVSGPISHHASSLDSEPGENPIPIGAGPGPSSSSSIIAGTSQASETTSPGCIPAPMLARITASLMNLDFGNTERARRATQLLSESIKGLCSGLSVEPPINDKPGDEGASTVMQVDGPTPPLDFYSDYVFSTLVVRNPPPQRRSQTGGEGMDDAGKAAQAGSTGVVNVLQVRKKKRPVGTS